MDNELATSIDLLKEEAEEAEAVADQGMDSEEEHMLDEDLKDLFAIAEHIGSFVEEYDAGKKVYVERFRRGDDCLEGIRAIQRQLRREDTDGAIIKPRREKLATWNVLPNKIVNLILAYPSDRLLMYEITKLLTRMTMMPSIDPRANIARDPHATTIIGNQVAQLQRYKMALLNPHVIATFMQMLERPLSLLTEPNSSSDEREQARRVTELVLALFKNLLEIPNPSPSAATTTAVSPSMQEELLVVLEKEHVLDMIVMLTQLVEEVEFRRWTLLLNEILKLIIGSNNASDVVRAKEASAQHKANKADGAGGEEKKEERERSSGMPPRGSGMKGDSPGDAFSIKKKRHFSRHPRFGGQYLVQRMGLTRLCDTVKEDPSLQLHQPAKRSRQVGHRRPVMESDFTPTVTTPLLDSVRVILYDTFTTLVESGGYHSLTKATQRLFVGQVSEVERRDREAFLIVSSFTLGLHREVEERRLKKAAAGDTVPFSALPVIASLDLWTIRNVQMYCDEGMEMKAFNLLNKATHMFMEILKMVLFMEATGDEQTRSIGRSLRQALFKEREVLDLIPRLLKKWEPVVFSQQYLHVLIECAHILLKACASVNGGRVVSRRRRRRKQAEGGGEEGGEGEGHDYEIVTRESDFDFSRYVADYCYNNVVKAYAAALATYRRNTPVINHYIATFFHRVMETPNRRGVSSSRKTVDPPTFTPMLFHTSLFFTIETLLNDKRFVKQKGNAFLVDVCRKVVRQFCAAVEENPLLYVEILFWRDAKTNAALSNNYMDFDPYPSNAKAGEEDNTAAYDAIRNAMSDVSDEEWDEDLGNYAPVHRSKAVKQGKNAKWSEEEDGAIRKMFSMWSSLPSCFDLMAIEDPFYDKGRTANQLKRRAKALGLELSQPSTEASEPRSSSTTLTFEQTMQSLVQSVTSLASLTDESTPSSDSQDVSMEDGGATVAKDAETKKAVEEDEDEGEATMFDDSPSMVESATAASKEMASGTVGGGGKNSSASNTLDSAPSTQGAAASATTTTKALSKERQASRAAALESLPDLVSWARECIERCLSWRNKNARTAASTMRAQAVATAAAAKAQRRKSTEGKRRRDIDLSDDDSEGLADLDGESSGSEGVDAEAVVAWNAEAMSLDVADVEEHFEALSLEASSLHGWHGSAGSHPAKAQDFSIVPTQPMQFLWLSCLHDSKARDRSVVAAAEGAEESTEEGQEESMTYTLPAAAVKPIAHLLTTLGWRCNGHDAWVKIPSNVPNKKLKQMLRFLRANGDGAGAGVSDSEGGNDSMSEEEEEEEEEAKTKRTVAKGRSMRHEREQGSDAEKDGSSSDSSMPSSQRSKKHLKRLKKGRGRRRPLFSMQDSDDDDDTHSSPHASHSTPSQQNSESDNDDNEDGTSQYGASRKDSMMEETPDTLKATEDDSMEGDAEALEKADAGSGEEEEEIILAEDEEDVVMSD